MDSTRDDCAIAADIAASLRRLPAGHTLTVHVAHTADAPAESLTPQRRHGHFFAGSSVSRRVLVLVSRDECLVAGLEAREYVSLAAEVRADRVLHGTMAVDACIEKLDTSGELGARMPLARMLVAGYLCSLQKYHNALDIPAVGVHLFARAQHEYLFAKSRDNPGKHALDDLALVRWWKRTLDHALAYATSTMSSSLRHAAAGPDGCVTDGPHVRQPESTVAYCVVPGADASEAPALIGPQHDTGSGDAPAVDWRWGLPHPAESRAHDCVLQFPDDPVTRLLAEPHSKNWSVAMLLEMLSVSEECGAGHRTAYFSASLPVALATGHPASAQVGGSPRADQPTQASESAGQGTLTPEDYDNTLLALFDRDMDFSCSDSAARSSKRLAAYLTATFAIPSVTIATNGPATAHWPPAPRASAPPPVNDLTAAIRKRRKVDQ